MLWAGRNSKTEISRKSERSRIQTMRGRQVGKELASPKFIAASRRILEPARSSNWKF